MKTNKTDMVYISGAITDNKHYKRDFRRGYRKLRRMGYVNIINPAKLKLPKCAKWNDYMAMDMAILNRCNVIYVLNGYGKSKGAKRELSWAKLVKIKIIYER